MKNCSWYLWLGTKKIYNIRQLRENFCTDILIGYYYGGGLAKWLEDAEEFAVLEKVRGINDSSDIGTQLEFIFGVNPDKTDEPLPEPPVVRGIYKSPNESVDYNEIASFGENVSSFPSSFRNILLASSFNGGSFSLGSFRSGSFGFGFGFGFGKGGSFSSGSFNRGSFKGGFGSFRVFGSFSGYGSFYFTENGLVITETEYKRTLINLSSCPLNEYGYGINLV